MEKDIAVYALGVALRSIITLAAAARVNALHVYAVLQAHTLACRGLLGQPGPAEREALEAAERIAREMAEEIRRYLRSERVVAQGEPKGEE